MRLSLLILVLSVASAAAQNDLDSLWKAWNNPTLADTLRIKALDTYIAEGVLYKDNDRARSLANEEVGFAEQMGSDFWKAESRDQLASVFYAQGNLLRAADMFKQSLAFKEKVGDQEEIAKSLNNIAVMYSMMGNPSEAINHYMKSLRIREQSGDSSGIAAILGNLGLLYRDQEQFDKAIELFERTLKINESVADTSRTSKTLSNLGIVYAQKGDHARATVHFNRALLMKEAEGDERGLANLLANIGGHYFMIGKVDTGQLYMERSLELGRRTGHQTIIITNLVNLAEVYQAQGQLTKAIKSSEEALELARSIGSLSKVVGASRSLYDLYKEAGSAAKALEAYEQYISANDSLKSEENQREIIRQEYAYEYEKEALTNSLEFAKREAVMTERTEKQRIGLFAAGGGLVLLLSLAFAIYSGKKRSDELLRNILPEETAKELKDKGHSDAKLIDEATVLFTDFKGFTAMSEQLSPKELVKDLHECFSAFDRICEKYGIEKIKTIGDAYMAAGGLPTPNSTHAQDVVKAALEMARVVEEGKAKKKTEGHPYFEVRIGVHTGPVVAGIVGIKKFQYDIWGDTVNTASRMESSGEVGKVNISEATYALVKDGFACEYRGEIEAKGKGKLGMYFVNAT